MKLINKATKESWDIITNHSMTLAEAIECVGGTIYMDDKHMDEDVEIDGKEYYYDDFTMTTGETTAQEFVTNLWENCPDYNLPMTLATAQQDFEEFHRLSWDIPADLTPETYTDIWNALVFSQKVDNAWDAIVSMMDDATRETVHAELAPCSNVVFLNRYLELDPDFAGILKSEFSIDADPGLSDAQADAARTAKAIRNQDTWDPDLCAHLCDLAGLSAEYHKADGETFESVVFSAAEKLGVKII